MNKKIFLKNNTKGSLTLELLIAFVILTLNISAVMLIINGGQSLSVDTQTNNEALAKAENIIEKAKSDAKLDFNLVNPFTYLPDFYNKKLLVEQVDFFTKKITSLITWKTDGGRDQTITLTSLLTNPDATNGGNTCSSVLEGDWTNPQLTDYEFGAEILNDPSSGFPVSSIQSFKQKLYVTVHNTHGNNDGTFFILDSSHTPELRPGVVVNGDAVDPILQLDNNPSIKTGLNALAIDGDHYAYVASANGSNFTTCPNNNGTNLSCGQMQVIDLDTLSVVYTYKVPGITGDGGQGIGTSIFYKDGIVYLGLANDPVGTEFNIIDVGGGGISGASPTSPKPMGNFEIGNGINAIYKKDNYVYIASPNNEELIILDVSDLTNPVQVGSFDAPGGGANNGNGKSIYLVGNILYLGRTLLSGDEFYILNNTNSETTLPILDSKNIQDSDDGQQPAPDNTSINGILIRDYLAFLITKTEFQIWDISNSPTTITPYATPLILPPGSGGVQGSATDCEGNYIYVGSQKTATGAGGQDKGYISVITSSPI